MANCYVQSASLLPIPKEKLEEAKKIAYDAYLTCKITRACEELGVTSDKLHEYGISLATPEAAAETLEDYNVGVEYELTPQGVWIYGGEFFDSSYAEIIARELIEKLEIEEEFVCTWAVTCSKPRLDSFAGGGFGVRRGIPTVWVDAESEVRRRLKSKLESQVAGETAGVTENE